MCIYIIYICTNFLYIYCIYIRIYIYSTSSIFPYRSGSLSNLSFCYSSSLSLTADPVPGGLVAGGRRERVILLPLV